MICLKRAFLILVACTVAGCAGLDEQRTRKVSNADVAHDTSRTIDLTHPPHDMWDRVRRGFAIPNLHSERVDHWTNYYASHPRSVWAMTQRAGKYLYHIMDELDQRGMPSELALLPFVESAYDPTALSRSQASGLWQFIPSTGRHFNLQQDWWQDQRRDPVASTAAALDYLARLYEMQGDWYLALASYNWGEGAVRRAMAKNEKAGLPQDYLSLKMPEQTANYVPRLQAIKNLIAAPERYGLALPDISNTPYFAMVPRHHNIDVEVAAQLAEMPVDEFRALNPSHKRPVILAEGDTPPLLLPADRVDIFNSNLREYKGRLSAWKIHTPSQGESYASIAKQYGVSLSQLRQINDLGRHARPVARQALLVPDTSPDPLANILMAGRHRISLAALDVSSVARLSIRQTAQADRQADNAPPAATRKPQEPARMHRVRPGDTLYGLARRYNTSVAELRRINRIKGSHLARGARLRIPGKGTSS
ncbi:MAG: transglycosylase SLT domain-containing protein [Castellaniella sp.]